MTDILWFDDSLNGNDNIFFFLSDSVVVKVKMNMQDVNDNIGVPDVNIKNKDY